MLSRMDFFTSSLLLLYNFASGLEIIITKNKRKIEKGGKLNELENRREKKKNGIC